MPTFAQSILRFFKGLQLDARLPEGVEVLNPYVDPDRFDYVRQFCNRFYNDRTQRVSVWGINPGRHGGGLTGIAFTDPYALKTFCGIPNEIPGKRELSSEFVYTFIESFGGAESFYRSFYIGSLCPLGFVKDGRNYNFYDQSATQHAVLPFIVRTMQQQLQAGLRTDVAICFGTGKLYDVFRTINSQYRFFNEIIPVEHPRFIMQYRRKNMDEYVRKYCEVFSSLTPSESVP